MEGESAQGFGGTIDAAVASAQHAGVSGQIVAGGVIAFFVLLLAGGAILFNKRVNKPEHGEAVHAAPDGAVLMAIGNLGELVREKTGHLGEQLKTLERKMDDHAESDVREFGRLRDSVGTIFATQATHGQDLATLKAHREQWEPGKPERRART